MNLPKKKKKEETKKKRKENQATDLEYSKLLKMLDYVIW
jgi:hypothetical protein